MAHITGAPNFCGPCCICKRSRLLPRTVKLLFSRCVSGALALILANPASTVQLGLTRRTKRLGVSTAIRSIGRFAKSGDVVSKTDTLKSKGKWLGVGGTTIRSAKPSVSTSRWRLRPHKFLAPSNFPGVPGLAAIVVFFAY
jgi:hypothetical protein